MQKLPAALLVFHHHTLFSQTRSIKPLDCKKSGYLPHLKAQATQTLFVIYIRDSIALRFEPFKRMYENGSKIGLNSTCSKGFK